MLLQLFVVATYFCDHLVLLASVENGHNKTTDFIVLIF